MKTIFFAIIITISTTISTLAQGNFKHDGKLGIVGGPQLSSFSNSDINLDYTLNRYIGITYTFPLNKRLSLEPQIIYNRKGAKGNYNLPSIYQGEIRFKFDYLEIPLLLNIYTKSRFDIVFGCYTSILLNTKFDFSNPFIYGTGELNDNDFEKFDMGFITGMSYKLKRIKITLKYSQGLIDVSKNGNSFLFLDDAKNSTISLSFTRYIFNRRR